MSRKRLSKKQLEKQQRISAQQGIYGRRSSTPVSYAPNYAEGTNSAPVRASWKKLSHRGPVPVAPPSDFIQLTPIVQPIPLVPYSTQKQPMAIFDEEGDY